jgi:hypothetical protein
MGKGGLYVYIRAPSNSPENMKLKKLILEKKKKKFKKMKNEKSYPFHPLTHPIKKINRPTPKNRNTAVFCV